MRLKCLFVPSEMVKYLVVIVMVCNMSAQVFAADLAFATHSSEEQTWTDEKGELRGNGGRRAFYVELVRELMSTMKVPKVIAQFPLARGMKLVQSQDDQVFFNVVRTPERESTVKWVGPIDEGSASHLYEMKAFPTGVKTLEDAKKVKSIGVLRSGIHEATLTAKGFKNLYPVNNYNQALLMLKLNRIELTALSPANIGSRLKEAALAPDEIVLTPVVVSDAPGYMTFSKNIPDEVVEQWRAALQQVRKSGKYDQLYASYFVAEPQLSR